mmetsp:Transcript_81317/g.263373  ORF Transcript_81317/g.263373 Transcript_81317/m.263373 type:complete len:240 (-) Transcript_81317:618-1337(-)
MAAVRDLLILLACAAGARAFGPRALESAVLESWQREEHLQESSRTQPMPPGALSSGKELAVENPIVAEELHSAGDMLNKLSKLERTDGNAAGSTATSTNAPGSGEGAADQEAQKGEANGTADGARNGTGNGTLKSAVDLSPDEKIEVIEDLIYVEGSMEHQLAAFGSRLRSICYTITIIMVLLGALVIYWVHSQKLRPVHGCATVLCVLTPTFWPCGWLALSMAFFIFCSASSFASLTS